MRLVRAVEGYECVVCNLCRLARTPTGLCCTCSVRDIARYFQCDVQFFGVQFVLSIAIVPFGAQGQFADHGTEDEVTEIQC